MSKGKSYKIFSKSLPQKLYILNDPADNQLEFSRDGWNECKLTMGGEDLVKIDVMEFQPLVIALNFAFETALNNTIFLRTRPFSFKVKGNYYNNELKKINWKWKYDEIWSSKFILIDKKNKGKELAKIDIHTMIGELSGSFNISDAVPSELHSLIVASACLAIKDVHDSLNPIKNSADANRNAALNFSIGSIYI